MAKDIYLKLDTKGHTGIIKDIIVTKSGDIISASDDKTIRVWDSQTGKEKRKILGQIGEDNGEIFAIALSPDERYLAVGGFLGKNGNLKEVGSIRIYDYQTGKLIKLLKSHTNVVSDLAFSKDGKYLISGSADYTAKIWRVENWSLKDSIKAHKREVYAVRIIKKYNRYFAVTAGYDNKITLYDMKDKKVINSHKLKYKLQYLATSKKHIATCGFGREIRVYDFNLNPVTTIKSETEPSGLAYSKDGKYLIAGTGKHPHNVNIYDASKDYKRIQSFKKHKNLTQAVGFLDSKRAISGGGDNNEIYIWDIKSGKVLKKIVGVGQRVWSVGIDGDIVAWGNHLNPKNINNRGELQKQIDLNTFQIKEVKRQSNFHRIKTVYKNYSLSHRKGGDYGQSDAVLDIKRGGRVVASIIRGSTDGYGHNCYGFYKKYIVSAGSSGQLRVYNLKGEEVANLIGHTGEIWSIALDGDRLVSGSDDQTIKVWDLSEIEKREFNEKYINEWMREFGISREDVIKEAKELGDNRIYKSIKIKPQFSVFVSKTSLKNNERKYIVQFGDNLYKIAKKFGVSIKSILKLNNLKYETVQNFVSPNR